MSVQPYVKTTIKEGIGTVEFFHPSHNALPGKLLSELATAITEAGTNDAIKVIILKSGGDRTFCAGASFNELIAIDDLEAGKQFFSGFANVINACRTCPKFIIGRVQGKAVGGGVGVASATDYCMATKYASVKLSELHVGIGPFVVGPAVSRKIGVSAMSQLAINANAFQTAAWAREKGLYTEVFEDIEALDAGVMEMANTLLTYNPDAMREMKTVFWEGTEHWDELLAKRAMISGRLVLSAYTKATLAKYRQ
ncbi:MAG: enoyl-CoA hydratase/isomerase family protein [Bacteroidota bacterium]